MTAGRGRVPRLFACLLLLLLTACIPLQYDLRLVKIGLVAPLSGAARAEGQRWVFAARDAGREWNQAEGSGRYRVELIAYDEADGPAVARRLVVDSEVLGVVGYLRTDHGVATTFQEAGMPFATLAPAGPTLRQQEAPAVRLVTRQDALDRLAAMSGLPPHAWENVPRTLSEIASWWPAPLRVFAEPDPGRALWLSSARGVPDTPEGRRFAAEYQERWRTPPSPLSVAAYDGVHAMLRGMAGALDGPEEQRRAAIGASLTQPYSGVAGDYRWDGSGEIAVPRAYLLDVSDGLPGRLVREVSSPR